MARFECRVHPGVTAIIGKSFCGKSTLARDRVSEMGGRWIVFDSQKSEAWNRFVAIESVAEAYKFLGGEASRGARWVRVIRLESIAAYESLAQTAAYWRGVRWLIDDAGRLMHSSIMADALTDVATTGRHKGEGAGVELWVCAHRAMEIPRAVRSQFERVIAFRQDEPDDLKKLAERTGSDFASQLPALGLGEFLEWSSAELFDTAVRSRKGAKK